MEGGDGVREMRAPVALVAADGDGGDAGNGGRGFGQGARYDCCFALHVMQTRVHGIAFRRAAAIGSPQSRQMPYIP